MANNETTMTQTASSLSAEAESFVPGRLMKSGGQPGKGPGIGDNCKGIGVDGDDSMTAQQINQLPRYITSCYPFVNSDSATNRSWQFQNRNPTGQFGGLATRMPTPGFNNLNNSKADGQFRHVKGQNLNIRTPFPGISSSISPPGPGMFGDGQAPVSGSVPNLAQNVAGLNPYIPYIPHMALPPSAPVINWPQNQGSSALDFTSQLGEQNLYHDGQQGPFSTILNSADWNGGNEHTKSSERKKKKKSDMPNQSMVSIGIQNESGVQHNSASGSKKKAKTRTMICKHAEIQTDFSDEIANLTLAEKPNSLYHKDNRSRSWLQRYHQDSSTESEEKDSDSGYSSPLHRRNQASNGTHPVIGLPYGQPGLIAAPHSTAALMSRNPGMYPPFVPPSSVSAYSGYSPTQGLISNISSYARAAATYNIPQYTVPPLPLPPSTVHLNTIKNLDTPPVSAPASSTLSHANTTTNSTTNMTVVSVKTEPDDEESVSGKKKRRRSRRKKHRSSGEDVGALSDELYGLHRAHSSSNVSRTSTIENDLTLHFDDEDEFPNLLSAAGGLHSSTPSQSSAPLSYSDILKSQVPCLSQESSVSSVDHPRYTGLQSGSSTPSATGKESKNARKRRKRRELASKAADEELAEISLEQHVLKELSSKTVVSQNKVAKSAPAQPAPKAQPAGKKSKQPISLNFADMINALEKQQEKQKQQHQIHSSKAEKDNTTTNPLDSSAPSKRGKEREVPKVKKPSPLKKVILKEREEKKRLRLLDETDPLSPESSNSSQLASVAGMPIDSDLSQDAGSSKASSMDLTGTPASAEMSPISQTSPISMSPLSGSPLSSGVNSPIAGNTHIGPSKSSVQMKIHSRRFREYCNQVLDKDIDMSCTLLLQDLVRFQDRLYHKDPIKAKSKRRIVLGLREVTKHLKLNRIKCVIISPNLERIQSKGGLDEALNNIIDLCTEQGVPFVFALGRRALGRACAKLVPVSVAGVFNYEGAEEHFKNVMDLSEQARSQYMEMVTSLEKEMDTMPRNAAAVTTVGGFAQLFPHLGHSRTPSACSAISFTSSILSEPISENYPHSEPETDSRGYEIIRDGAKTPGSKPGVLKQLEKVTDEVNDVDDTEHTDSLDSSNGKRIIVECLNEYDADTEEVDTMTRPRKRASVSIASTIEDIAVPPAESAANDDSEPDDPTYPDFEDEADDSGSCSGKSDQDSKTEKDTLVALPHIDSLHSLNGDATIESLSQHSSTSKTLDLNAEVMSTHSSKTLEGERGGRVTPDCTPRPINANSDPHDNNASIATPSQRLRNVNNKERVQTWVTETQKHLERLTILPGDMAGTNNNMIATDKVNDRKHAGSDLVAAAPVERSSSPAYGKKNSNKDTMIT